MNSILTAIDLVLCLVIVLASLDYLRAVYFLDQPVVSLAFYMVAIGSFGYGLSLMSGHQPSPWSVLTHLGIVSYASVHYSNIFSHHWIWDGKERREHGNR